MNIKIVIGLFILACSGILAVYNNVWLSVIGFIIGFYTIVKATERGIEPTT